MRTETTRKLPPFFTQVIGSLPRPKMVRSLHARRHQMSEERFRKVMDDMVLFAIPLQEEAGLDVVSNGEWRRVQYVDEVGIRYWHESFSTEVYPTLQHFMDHLSEILAREARALQ